MNYWVLSARPTPASSRCWLAGFVTTPETPGNYSGDARELLRTGRLTGEDDDIELGCQLRQVLQDFAA